jgi:predicted esterase
MNTLSFTHIYRPPTAPGAATLLMLHGTGGNEHDLVPLAAELLPGAGVLSPRGKVLERGMPRFFRRLSEGVFDIEDLKQRSAELADFVQEASKHYRFDATRVTAVGFSNGANIAGSLVLLRPGVISRAVLYRAMVPLVPDPLPVAASTSVLISNGRVDPLVPVAETERLASLFRAAQINVSVVWQQAGHQLVHDDITNARAWLEHEDPRRDSTKIHEGTNTKSPEAINTKDPRSDKHEDPRRDRHGDPRTS